MKEQITLAHRSGKLILTAAILASGLGFLMNSAVTIALPTIQSTLNTDLGGVQWIVNAYVLTLSALILVSGSLGDIFGTRRVFNLGIAVFTLGSVGSGLAPTLHWLIALRAVQGLGAALMVPGSLAIINIVFPEQQRGTVIGLWAGLSGAIAALGPFLGGFLASISWRMVFLAASPFGIAAFIVTRLFVPRLEGGRSGHIDWIGSILVLVGLTGVSFALIRLPDRGMGSSVAIPGMAGLVALILFFLAEKRAKHPFVPYRMFTVDVLGANLATLFLYFSFSGVMFLLSFHLQQYVGLGPTVAGLGILPATVLIALLSGPSGRITDSRGPRLQMLLGPGLVAFGMAVIIFRASTAAYLPAILIGVAALGTGMVSIIPAITKTALNVESAFSGSASGVNNAIARTAGLFAVATVGATLRIFFSHRLSVELSALSLQPQQLHAIVSRADRLLSLSIPANLSSAQTEAVRGAMRSAYTLAFRVSMGVTLFAAATSGVISYFTIGLSSHKRTRRGSQTT